LFSDKRNLKTKIRKAPQTKNDLKWTFTMLPSTFCRHAKDVDSLKRSFHSFAVCEALSLFAGVFV